MIRFLAGHPTAANLLMIGFLAFGAIAMPTLKRETFPDLPLDTVEVSAVYRGAATEDVADTVCRRFEDAVDAVNGVEEVRCEAQQGKATASLEMLEGRDITVFLDDIKTEIDAIDDFPPDVEAPIVKILNRNEFVAAIAVTGEMSDVDLKSYAEQLKQRMQAITAISEIQITGFSDRQIRIEIPALALARHGLSILDIANTVGRQSLDRPLGELLQPDSDILIRLTEERRSVRQLEDLVVVGSATGAEVKLGEIGTVTARFEDAFDRIEFDGRRAAMIRVFKNRSQDTLTAIDAVRAFVAEERARSPSSVAMTVTQDVSTIVRDRLTMLIKNALQGIILVAATLWLFFGLRFSFWVAMGLPVSFMGAFGVMSLFGLSIDMITMVGLLISIGLLMDDAIVIAENIATHFRGGKSPLAAAIDGTREVLPGVAASFATTVSVFGALAFISGDIGNVLKFIPIVLIITLAVSMVEAFFILPNHMSHAVHKRGEPGRIGTAVERGLSWLTENVAGHLADWAVRRRYLTLGLSLFLLFASIAMLAGGVVKFQAFPDLEGDVVEARILLPQGTPLNRTVQVTDHLLQALTDVDADLSRREAEGEKLVQHVSVQYGKNADAFERGAHVATITVDLLSSEQRHSLSDEILERWRATAGIIPDVVNIKFTELQIGLAGRAIEVRLAGLPLSQLKQASQDLQAWLRDYEGALDIDDDLRPGKPEIRVRMRDGAQVLGLDARSLGDQLSTALLGRVANEIQVGPESLEIDIRLAAEDRDSLAGLETLRIKLPNGREVPLITVATLEADRGWARIHRIDSQPTITIAGDIDRTRANASEVVRHTKTHFLPKLQQSYPGLSVIFEGEQASGAETQASIVRAFMMGLIGVFLLLAYQFRSYILPPVMMMIIPMALIGVIWGHMIMGFDISMPSMVGFVSLAGIVVNNAILMVQFVNLGLAQGMEIEDAARAAARRRFRPMFLTSLTTILGLLPLLSETSLQAQVMQPLVVSLVFGLLATTLLVLALVPALLSVLHDLRLVDRPTAAPEEGQPVERTVQA